MPARLSHLPSTARLAIGGFVVLVMGLHLLAQATLWLTAGEGSLPGPAEVLGKYHGRPDRSRLHEVLDLARAPDDPRAMFWYLDPASGPDNLDLVEARRHVVLGWVEAGAPLEGWPDVRRVLHEEAMCLQCHGFGGEQFARAPLESYEQVKAAAAPGRGIGLSALLVSAHNHVFVFAVMALLLGLGAAWTAVRGAVRLPLVLGAFAGAAIDVTCWFLTRAHGSPWEYGVILGGALFGSTTGALAVLVLDEVAFGGRVARALGLAPGPDPAGPDAASPSA